MQAQRDNGDTRDLPQLGLIRNQKRVDGRSACAKRDKDDGKAADKSQSAGQDAGYGLALFVQFAQFGKLQTGGKA